VTEGVDAAHRRMIHRGAGRVQRFSVDRRGGVAPIYTDSLETRPVVSLQPGRDKRAAHGHPWIYSNEIVLDPAAKSLPPGCLVTVATSAGRRLGVATFNPHTLISLRLFDRDPGRVIDRSFFASRFRRALEIRTRLFAEPYYRLIHAEADGVPGLVIDRYGTVVVAQLNTAGIVALEAEIVAALAMVLDPETIVRRADGGQLEQVDGETNVIGNALSGPVTIVENGITYRADLLTGQKTGWFYDQRRNRAFVADLARGARVLDVYAYSGGFGLLAAARGASSVTLLDRSAPALEFARQSAAENGIAALVQLQAAEAFEGLEALKTEGERFDIVVLDPPAFVKSKKDLGPGSRGYRKLVRLGAALVARHGYLFAASCSHNMPLDAFHEAVAQGLSDAGRTGRILRTGFAGPDHPVHPALPESAYLKSLTLALD
jgi:23S rRNA (cytosine1962-C5)-methyltransferase